MEGKPEQKGQQHTYAGRATTEIPAAFAGRVDSALWQRLANVQLLALDVDGTLSDGRIIIGENAELCKNFNCKDGLGISCALRQGIRVVIITGRKSGILEVRARELAITELLPGVHDKATALRQVAAKYGVPLAQTAFMGDDLNDLAGLRVAAVKACPADAVPEVVARCNFVSRFDGGRGAVRELVEAMLKARGVWAQVVADYENTGQGDRQ